jgi:hypothetical protein
MNARQAVAQGRSTEYRDARSTDRETGLGSKVIVLSERSTTRGHLHFRDESPTEVHMKVRTAVKTLAHDIDPIPYLG